MRLFALAGALTCLLIAGIGAGISVWTTRENHVQPAAPVARATSPPQPVPPKLASPLPVAAALAPVLPNPPVAPPEIAPSAPDPRETAIDLLSIIHQAGLCRSGSVDVEISSDSEVTVKGTVDTAAQVNALKVLLSSVRAPFQVAVRSAEDVNARVPTTATQSAPSMPSTAATPPLGEGLIERWLRSQHLEASLAPAESLRISNRIVHLASDAWIESWAARRLLDRFGANEIRELPETSRNRLSQMVHAHLDSMVHIIAEERDLVTPLLPEESPNAVRVKLADVARLSAMLQDTFAGTPQRSESPQDRINQLHDLLASIASAAPQWASHPQ